MMALSRAASRLKVSSQSCPQPWTPARLLSTAGRPTENYTRSEPKLRPRPTSNPDQKPKPRKMPWAHVPDNAKNFLVNGKLTTTRENIEFLREYGIQPDNESMMQFLPTRAVRKVASDFQVVIGFSPWPVLRSHDLKYFDPRGHPLAPMMRARYIRDLAESPLRVVTNCAGSASAVVRLKSQRVLRQAIYKALEDLGYKASGKGPDGDIRGTLLLIVRNPIVAARLPAERFGQAVAEALVANQT